jgi:superkiller protein 3
MALGAVVAVLSWAQAPPPKPVDIGAREAPLSDEERTDLAQAVAKHNYAAERAVIDRAMAEHPLSRELQVMAGRIAYLEKHPKDAAEAFERADKIKPLSEDDRMTLALAEQFSGQPDSARGEMLRLTRDFPGNAQYEYLLGRFSAQNQHLEDAAVDFRKAIELDPNLMRAYEELGQAQENLGLTDEARQTYEKAATRNRLQPTPWEWSPLDLGVVLLKNGELDGAEKLFQEALQYNRRFGWAHYYLGQLHEKQGRRPESLAEYRAAVVDTPTLRQAWLALGREYTRQGQKAEADKCLAIFRQLEDRDNARRDKK